MSNPANDVTRILRRSPTETAEPDPLVGAVYDQLKAIARHRMASERSDHTLDATALVHESFLRISKQGPVAWDSRGHFFAAAAEAMRRVLVEHARKKQSEKRGKGWRNLPFDVADLAVHASGTDILQLEDALETLAREDARSADVIRLRFYAGLTVQEVAETLGISERTVMREQSFARARLYQLFELAEKHDPGTE